MDRQETQWIHLAHNSDQCARYSAWPAERLLASEEGSPACPFYHVPMHGTFIGYKACKSCSVQGGHERTRCRFAFCRTISSASCVQFISNVQFLESRNTMFRPLLGLPGLLWGFVRKLIMHTHTICACQMATLTVYSPVQFRLHSPSCTYPVRVVRCKDFGPMECYSVLSGSPASGQLREELRSFEMFDTYLTSYTASRPAIFTLNGFTSVTVTNAASLTTTQPC